MTASAIRQRTQQMEAREAKHHRRYLRFLLVWLSAVTSLLFGQRAVNAAAPAAVAVSVPPTTQIALDGHNFTLPQGFTIKRVAGSPLVDRPIVADLDERGRLYVADSSGSVEKTDIQLQKKP